MKIEKRITIANCAIWANAGLSLYGLIYHNHDLINLTALFACGYLLGAWAWRDRK
jgi:hypothetical protein